MNNWIGLLIALSLALVAGVLNWKYLERKTTEIEMISFMAIGDGQRVGAGDKFLEKHFVSLDIPRKNSSYLSDSAVFFEDRDTVVGMKALRNYRTGDLILRQELKTPPAELNLAADEVAMWISVGGSTFVPSLITPGDEVSFIVPKPGQLMKRGSRQASPPPLDSGVEKDPKEWNFDDKEPDLIMATLATEEIGPFRVISVGGRLGSDRVERLTGGKSSGQQNTLGIALKRVGKGFEPKADKLRDYVISSGFRNAGVFLHPRKKKK
jgi:hypothetical protein